MEPERDGLHSCHLLQFTSAAAWSHGECPHCRRRPRVIHVICISVCGSTGTFAISFVWFNCNKDLVRVSAADLVVMLYPCPCKKRPGAGAPAVKLTSSATRQLQPTTALRLLLYSNYRCTPGQRRMRVCLVGWCDVWSHECKYR